MKTRELLLSLSLLLAAPAAHANSGVAWQSLPFDSFFNGRSLFDANGNLLDSSFTFELGTFGTTFTPTLANINQWATNWKLLNRATSPVDAFGHGWDTASQAFGNEFSFDGAGKVQGLAGSATFSNGEQAYLWVYNGSEWALVTNDSPLSPPDQIWQLPDPFAAIGTKPTWVLDDGVNHVIFGGLNGVQSGAPANVDMGSAMRLQTAVIPEPGSSLLVLLAGIVVRLRRSMRRDQ